MVRFQASGGVEISIHALREESDRLNLPPAQSWIYFYPRPPRGERQTGGFDSDRI